MIFYIFFHFKCYIFFIFSSLDYYQLRICQITHYQSYFIILNQQMGSENGSIHNQTNGTLTYIIHNKQFTFDDIFTIQKCRDKLVGFDRNLVEGSSPVPGQAKNFINKIQCCFTIKAKRICVNGFDDLDLKKDWYFTFLENDKVRQNSIKIHNQDGINIKVLPSFKVIELSKDQIKKWDKYVEGTFGTGKCPEPQCSECQSQNKPNYQNKKRCGNCGAPSLNLWICKNMPANHAECEFCYGVRIKQRFRIRDNQ